MIKLKSSRKCRMKRTSRKNEKLEDEKKTGEKKRKEKWRGKEKERREKKKKEKKKRRSAPRDVESEELLDDSPSSVDGHEEAPAAHYSTHQAEDCRHRTPVRYRRQTPTTTHPPALVCSLV